MNKQELITATAEKTGFSKKDTEAVLNAALETISKAMEENEKVQTQWQNFPLEQHKRRRCWVKELGAVPSAAAPNESACQ